MSNSSTSPLFLKEVSLAVIILGVIITNVVIMQTIYHQNIEKMNCKELKFNLGIPEDKRYGESIYKFYPHLVKNFEEKCILTEEMRK